MAQDEIDNGNGVLANQQENIVQAQSGEGQADVQNGEARPGGQTQSGEGSPQPSQSAGNQQTPPGLPGRLSEERRAKLAALLAGTSGFDPKQPSFSAMPKGVSGYEAKKEEPLIGPDGGMVGRGIKSAGDAYQEYIDGQRDGLMETMKEKMTPPDWAVDALATGAHSATTMLTGFDTGYEPKYPGNKVFQVGALFPKAVDGVLPRGFGATRSLMVPLPALVQGASWLGGNQVKPSEAVRAAASLVQTGVGARYGFGSSEALKGQESVEKATESLIETHKLLPGQR